jgi:hypothetical protein
MLTSIDYAYHDRHGLCRVITFEMPNSVELLILLPAYTERSSEFARLAERITPDLPCGPWVLTERTRENGDSYYCPVLANG